MKITEILTNSIHSENINKMVISASPSSSAEIRLDDFFTFDDFISEMVDLGMKQRDSFSSLPRIIQICLITNIGFWLAWQLFPETMRKHTACSQENLEQGRPWSLALSALSHLSPIHLLCNMSVLSQFGPLVLKELGNKAFFGLIVSSSLLGGMAPLIWDNLTKILIYRKQLPNQQIKKSYIGFSAVNSAILYMFSRLRPNNMASFMDFPPTRMKKMIEYIIAGDIAGAVVNTFMFSTGISHIGHLGGFLAGHLTKIFLCDTQIGRDLIGWSCFNALSGRIWKD